MSDVSHVNLFLYYGGSLPPHELKQKFFPRENIKVLQIFLKNSDSIRYIDHE